MATDALAGNSLILSVPDAERERIVGEYFRTAPSGVAHFPCPAALKPPQTDPYDGRTWAIYAIDGRSGYVVDHDFIDRAARHEKFTFVPMALIGLTVVSAILLLMSFFRNAGAIAFTATFTVVGLAAWVFWSGVFYLPLGFRLRGRQRVIFGDELAQAIASVQQASDKRSAIISTVVRAAGMATGLAVGELLQPGAEGFARSVGRSPVADKLGEVAGHATTATLESAAKGHVNRHTEHLASGRPAKAGENPG